MGQTNIKSFVMYQGNGSNNVFSIPMVKGFYGTISVAFVRRGKAVYDFNPTTWTINGNLFAWDVGGGSFFYTNTAAPATGAVAYNEYGVANEYEVASISGTSIEFSMDGHPNVSGMRDTESDIDENTLLTWTGDVLNVGDFIVIQRTTIPQQPYNFPNNQKHIEKSDDNIERQVQENTDKLGTALVIDPTFEIDTNKMTPAQWLETIVRSRDLSAREIRVMGKQLFYSTDDPEAADGDKLWTGLPNVFGFRSFRYAENTIDGITYKWIEAEKDGTWFPIAGSLPNRDGVQSDTIKGLEWVGDDLILTVANVGEITISGLTTFQSQIDANTADIAALQVVGGALTAADLGVNPTNKSLTVYAVGQIFPGFNVFVWDSENPANSTFVDADRNPHTAGEIFNGTWVNNTYDDHRWQLTNTQNTTPKVFEWADVGRDIVAVATATTAGIVRVGSGSQMVVNPTTGDISLDGTKAESIRGTIGAVATNQGTANTGKILTVGDDGNIELAAGASGAGRNIGDIFWTTRTDSALNGAVEANGAQYNTEDYDGDGSIGELLESGKLPYVSLAQYASLLTTNGVCGVFGWDGENAFRVPTLRDVFIECGQVSELGDYIPAGLPNITGKIRAIVKNKTNEGAFIYGNSNSSKDSYSSNYDVNKILDFDASRSSSIYGNSTTVQPEAVKYRAMIQLFNGTTDEAVATVGTVVAQVGENTTQIANRVIKGHELIDFQIPTAENGYTWYRKYADGWVEQGGNISGSSVATVNLPVVMTDTLYTVVLGNTSGVWEQIQSRNKTTVGFQFRNANGDVPASADWLVSGIAAQ